MEYKILANKDGTIFKIGIKDEKLPFSNFYKKVPKIQLKDDKKYIDGLYRKFSSPFTSRSDAEIVLRYLNEAV